jgi:uncharacterized repeat protein (TIGR01451 family)
LKSLKFLLTIFSFAMLCGSSAQSPDLLWGHGISTNTGSMVVETMTIDQVGNVYTSGYYFGEVDFDPGVADLTKTGSRDIFIQKYSPNGDLLWLRTFERISPFVTNFECHAYGIKTDASGNVYVVGSFNDTLDFDPGLGTHIRGHNGWDEDIFIVKLDQNGGLLWCHTMGNSSENMALNIELDSFDDIYIAGEYQGDIDIDPGPSVYLLTDSNPSWKNIFVLKIDVGGNFLWAYDLKGPSSQCYLHDLDIDHNDNVYVGGAFSSTVDFDPGVGTFNLTTGSNSAFIQKVDKDANFMFAGSLGYPETVRSIDVDQYSNMYLCGAALAWVDLDPGPAVYNATMSGSSGGSIVKLDASGNFLSAATFDNQVSSFTNIFDVKVDQDGFLILSGVYHGTVDFDPGVGSHFLTATPNSFSWDDHFIARLDSTGNFLWSYSFGGFSDVTSSGLESDGNNNIVFSYSTIGGQLLQYIDPIDSLNTITEKTGLVKWGQDSCSNLAAIIDSVLNLDCTTNGYSSCFAANGQAPFTYTWNSSPPATDSFASFSNRGFYTVQVTDANSCTASATAFIDGPWYPTSFDMVGNLVAGHFTPGSQQIIHVDAFNSGCLPTSGEVRLVLDTILQYDWSVPAADLVNGDTLIWYYSGIDYNSAHLNYVVTVTLDSTATALDTVCLDLEIPVVLGEADLTNNNKHICYEVLNSFDPNDKQVYPQGICTPHFVENSQPLTYTIRFQNTGNTAAINILIQDSISADLDINTLAIVGTSHQPLITELLPGNVLQFSFDSIMLPDSSSDIHGSKGYVIFQLNPLPSTGNNELIKNNVDIYFDFNAPIITNTVYTTLVTDLHERDTMIVVNTCDSFALNNVVYYNTGIYQQVLSSNFGECDSVINIDVTIIYPDTLVTVNQVTLSSSADAQTSTFQWIDCDNNNAPVFGANSQDYVATANGNYAVIITENGCTDTSACYNISTVSVNKVSYPNFITVYPNPGDGNFSINWHSDIHSNLDCEIYSIEGKLVKNFIIAPNQSYIGLDELEAGQYIMVIRLEDRNYQRRLTIVE